MKSLCDSTPHRRSEVAQARGEDGRGSPDPDHRAPGPDPTPVWSPPGPSLHIHPDNRTIRARAPLNQNSVHNHATNPNPIHQDDIHNNNPHVEPINPTTAFKEPINPTTVYQHSIYPNSVYQHSNTPNTTNHDPINNQTIYQDPTSQKLIYQDPVNHNSVYQDPVNPNTLYQDPVNPNTLYQDPVNPNTLYQDPVNPNTLYQNPVHHVPLNPNTIYQEPINQGPINHNNIYQEPLNNENHNPIYPIYPIYHNPTICPDHVKQDSVGSLYPDMEGSSYTTVRRSALWPSRYRSRLMPGENQPLDAGLLRRVKEVLVNMEPRSAAQHITRADCMVAGILEVRVEDQRRMGVTSGVELLTLAHGHQLRLDLLERYHTMAVVLAVFILGCTGSPEERASLLRKAIQIAAQLKGSMGNLFGFSAVMRALALPQVARLDQTWTVLRQRHTECAVLYQQTLRPFLRALNQGKESAQLTGTSFPHVVPLLLLLERRAVFEGPGVWSIGGVESWEEEEPWGTEESLEEEGSSVEAILSHLAAARDMARLGGIYCANADVKLKGLPKQAEVSEVFQTDFQTRLLWGSRGAAQDPVQRYSKYHRVLTALSHQLEPPSPKH